MLHPSTRLTWVGDEVGYGVVATEFIPRGTITWVLDPFDRVLAPQEVERVQTNLAPALERFSYVTGRGDRILIWDFGRFLNHSCDANILSPGVEIEIAVRDVRPGEQLVIDYGELNVELPMDCQCGSPLCRRVVRRDDFVHMTTGWDRQLRDAFAAGAEVRQPLLKYVPDTLQIQGWFWDPGTMPSAGLNEHREFDAIGRARLH